MYYIDIWWDAILHMDTKRLHLPPTPSSPSFNWNPSTDQRKKTNQQRNYGCSKCLPYSVGTYNIHRQWIEQRLRPIQPLFRAYLRQTPIYVSPYTVYSIRSGVFRGNVGYSRIRTVRTSATTRSAHMCETMANIFGMCQNLFDCLECVLLATWKRTGHSINVV